MTDIFSFIDKRLDLFPYPSDFNEQALKNICKELNSKLNKPDNKDYYAYINENSILIKSLINVLFNLLTPYLQLSLYDLFILIDNYQKNTDIDGEKYRDHYIHSVQCFLLGMAIHPVLAPFNKNLNNKNTDDIVKIFSLSMYHDLGYLYKISKNSKRNINGTIRNLFSSCKSNDINVNIIKKILCLHDIDDNDFINIIDSSDILEIWNDNCLSPHERYVLKSELDLEEFPSKYYDHHSYYSTILLHRLMMTKSFFFENLNKTNIDKLKLKTNNSTLYDRQDVLMEIIEAVLYHDFHIEPKITIENKFWACFLMIIDELQTYGRAYTNSQYNSQIIDPSKVGFDIKNKKIILITDEDFCKNLPSDIKKAYAKHSTETVLSELSKKIQNDTLKKIFIY